MNRHKFIGGAALCVAAAFWTGFAFCATGESSVRLDISAETARIRKLVADDLAKARALGDALVRAQNPSGRIPTVMTKGGAAGKHVDWLNCMIADFEALTALADVTE